MGELKAYNPHFYTVGMGNPSDPSVGIPPAPKDVMAAITSDVETYLLWKASNVPEKVMLYLFLHGLVYRFLAYVVMRVFNRDKQT
jgi:hypothetical protein